jgi:hypothetical protein
MIDIAIVEQIAHILNLSLFAYPIVLGLAWVASRNEVLFEPLNWFTAWLAPIAYLQAIIIALLVVDFHARHGIIQMDRYSIIEYGVPPVTLGLMYAVIVPVMLYRWNIDVKDWGFR